MPLGVLSFRACCGKGLRPAHDSVSAKRTRPALSISAPSRQWRQGLPETPRLLACGPYPVNSGVADPARSKPSRLGCGRFNMIAKLVAVSAGVRFGSPALSYTGQLVADE